MTATVDTRELEAKVRQMYRDVALHPHRRFHFELGREVAAHLHYDVDRLARVLPRPWSRSRASATTSTSRTSSRARSWWTWAVGRDGRVLRGRPGGSYRSGDRRGLHR